MGPQQYYFFDTQTKEIIGNYRPEGTQFKNDKARNWRFEKYSTECTVHTQTRRPIRIT